MMLYSHLVEGLEVKLAELLNVNRSSILIAEEELKCENTMPLISFARAAHLVRLVVVLRVVLIDLFLLGVLKLVVELLDTELLPPLLSLSEHGLGGRKIPLSGSEEAAD